MTEAAETGKDIGFTARCLLRKARWATLATQSGGQPFAALVTHAVAPDGAALMLLSSMSEHARQLEAEPRCGLMVTGEPENLNWQTAPRLSLSGRAARAEDPSLRRYWVRHHPYARMYADFTDFSIWRLVPESGLFVAGFGQINRLDAQQLACVGPAAASLAVAQAKIVAGCNAEHASVLSRLAHAAGRSGRWAMLGVDPDGFTLAQDDAVLRIAFHAPIADAAGVPAALAALAAG